MILLYRPVGPRELDLIRKSEFTEFPARLPGQPIFYPVLNREYAAQVARDWNATDEQADYSGFVTAFHVDAEFLARYSPKQVGGSLHQEYWVPAEDLPEFNRHIRGRIEIVEEYHGAPEGAV